MMDLTALLPRHHVLLQLAGDGLDQIITALAQPLVTDGMITDARKFVTDVEAREIQITTQLADAIAFPHARSTAVRRLALSVGVAAEPGLLFSVKASKPCRIFFLIAVPFFAPTAHLPLLQRLANFAHNPQRVGKLLDATTPGQVVRLLTMFKG